MEKYKKKDMLQAVDTLLRANDVIIKTVTSNPPGAAEVLIQCQESAIALGTYIDTLDEKYADLVYILEDYCENIYQMSASLPDENVCRKVSKKIQKQLMVLKNGIRYDMPDDRKEVVFLPYKASMWDSLESVWKAADEDPECDAYVIPIPYFDKNPDGSFREEHYEGNEYPKYVPVTRYDEYDLEANHPDVIYIHNPYDEYNHVTSVHPYFYSRNLRKYTDRLVYIPYFILKEIEPDDQEAIDGMKHFCFTPGTIYADQVIVQSESMRQIYINEYIKAAEEMGLSGEHVDRKFLEKKFLGTGSPKIDKVLNTRKEDLEIPAEWLKVIEKPDGSWKKIVLYNTSINALLRHNEDMLRKMEYVFRIFREKQDEVALLWRPHPLIESTLVSMRPQLWEIYKKIRDRYLKENWGIYDSSADLDRAIILSDVYYGNYSSVVMLYQKTSKRILLQNCHITENSFDCLDVEDFCYKNRCVYFLSHEPNALWKYSYDLCKVELLCILGKKYDYRVFYEYKDYIILFPYYANDIKIYHLQTNQLNVVRIKNGLFDGYCANEYTAVFKCENILYCVGSVKTQILMFYLPELEVAFLQEKGYIELLSKDINVYSHRKGACTADNSLFMAVNRPGMMAEYNPLEKKMYYYDIPNCDMQIAVVAFDGSYFWLAGDKNRIVRWDKETNDSRVIELDYAQAKNESFLWKDWFSNVVVSGNAVYFAPLRANGFIRIDRDTLQIETIFNIESDQVCFVMKNLYEGKIFIKIEDERGTYNNYEIDLDNHVVTSEFSHIKDDEKILGDDLEELTYSEEICKSQLEMLIG